MLRCLTSPLFLVTFLLQESGSFWCLGLSNDGKPVLDSLPFLLIHVQIVSELRPRLQLCVPSIRTQGGTSSGWLQALFFSQLSREAHSQFAFHPTFNGVMALSSWTSST